MKHISFIIFPFLALLLFKCLTGCQSTTKINSLLTMSQEKALSNDQHIMAKAYKAYSCARDKNNIRQIIDTLTAALSFGKAMDTIYIIEHCNYPFFDYYASIWNRNSGYSIDDTGKIVDTVNEDIRFIELIETWNKKNILSKSHARPLVYESEKQRLTMCNRLIMNNGSCVECETICISDMDMDCPIIPLIIN